MSLLSLHCQLVMVRGKMNLVSSKLKAGENSICFVFINIFLRPILIEHCITALLGSGILFWNVPPVPPPFGALVHTTDLAQHAWSELPLDGIELQWALQVFTEWDLRPWNQTRLGLKSPFPSHALNVCTMDTACSALSGLLTRAVHIAKPDWGTET